MGLERGASSTMARLLSVADYWVCIIRCGGILCGRIEKLAKGGPLEVAGNKGTGARTIGFP